jgi:NADH:ubiquinone oxidoreductase subunit B-like Fe-S oxidoreductase
MDLIVDSIVARTPGAVALDAFSDELADRGFLVTTIDEVIQWARTGSLHLILSASPVARSK